ncbi:MAG: ABC transporter permease [Armatimonadetes bacterium]|nr:ABC transporter permease [Armatimonadota bacterium]
MRSSTRASGTTDRRGPEASGAAPPVRGLRPWRGIVFSPAWRRFRRHRAAQAGAVILAAFLLLGMVAPWIAPYAPEEIDLGQNLARPSRAHPFGTDQVGRDLLSRVIHGARISMLIGTISVGLGALLGLPVGAVGGYHGRWIDRTLMAVVDILLSFPPILLAIVVVVVFGPGLRNAMLAIGIAQMPIYARLMRGEILRVRTETFVEAARATGQSETRVLLRHVLPNSIAPIIVQSTLNLASAILSAAYLGFLGLGAQPPTPEWGAMMSEGRTYLRVAPHVSIFPGVAIMLAVLAFNLFGDGLRDALDPRMSRR